MIEIKSIRTVPAYSTCPVCRTRLAPKGSNVTVTIDAENEATAIKTVTHSLRAHDHRLHTRSRLHAS